MPEANDDSLCDADDAFAAMFARQIKEKMVKTAIANAINTRMKNAAKIRRKQKEAGYLEAPDPLARLQRSLLEIQLNHNSETTK